MRAAVIVFPGSNREKDTIQALKAVGIDAIQVWHSDETLPNTLDLVVLPGGFSYGDYLRSGAIAARTKIAPSLVKFIDKGGLVLGICNGFQILCELNILPGALRPNRDGHFIADQSWLKVETTDSPFTRCYSAQQVIRIRIAHGDGAYYADEDTLSQLEDNGQIAFRYCTESGLCTPESNPNGALNHIAGVFNRNRRVLGMMPHPENSIEERFGGTDGLPLFKSILNSLLSS